MGKLMMEEVIGHCERTVERFEKQMSREALEKRPIEEIFMKEYWEHRQVAEWLKELQAFKDKQEQGFLLVLKAKVGDDIFKIINGVISRLRITRIEVTNYGIEYFVWGYTLTNEGYGVTWFSTESEAESALAKMGGK